MRRVVSDAELRAALADRDNALVMHKVLRGFAGQIPEDDLESCGMHGMWRALACHDPARGQKFTTFLWRLVRNECVNQLERQARGRPAGTVRLAADLPSPAGRHEEDEGGRTPGVRDCLSRLTRLERELIEGHFDGGLTAADLARRHGLPAGKVRVRLGRALRRLRQLCREAGV